MRALLMTEEERELMLSLTAAVMDWRDARKSFLALPGADHDPWRTPKAIAERLEKAEAKLYELAQGLP